MSDNDWNNAVNYAEEIGHKKGLEIGAKKKSAEIARNLLAMGMPPADIAKATGLELAEIEAIK